MPKKDSKEKKETFTPNLTVYDLSGKEVETVALDATIFDGTVNTSVVHRAVVAYNANQRHGNRRCHGSGERSGDCQQRPRQLRSHRQC